MNSKKKLIILITFIFLILLLTLVLSADDFPQYAEGDIYDENSELIWRSVNISLENLNNSVIVSGVTSKVTPWHFKIPIKGESGDIANLTVWNRAHSNYDSNINLSSANLTITLNMTMPNYAPDFLTSPVTSATEDSQYFYDFTVEDYNLNNFNLSLVSGPSGMVMWEINQTIYWTPNQTHVDVGTYDVSIKAEDNNSAVTYQNFTITVNNVNDAPVFDTFASLSAKELENYSYDANASDDDGDNLTYAIIIAPATATINSSTGVFKWSPVQWDRGNHFVKLGVTDSQETAYQNFTLIVASKNNSQPNITSTPPIIAVQDQIYTYTVTAQDIDLQPLNISLTQAPSGSVIGNWVISWTPSQANIYTSPEQFVVLVQDNESGSDTQIFNVYVEDVNDRPVITSTPIYQAAYDSLYQYQATATDPDGDALEYTLTDSPSGMTINVDTGLIRWTPNASQFNMSHKVTLRVFDGELYAQMQVYHIFVLAPVPPAQTSSSGPNPSDETSQDSTGFGFSQDIIYNVTINFTDAFTDSFDLNTTKLKLLTYSTRPKELPVPEWIVYKYFLLEMNNVTDDDINNVTMKFKVSESFFKKANATKDDIVMIRYVNESWDVLKTQFFLENKSTHFLSSSKGIGYVAIAAYNKTKLGDTSVRIPTPKFLEPNLNISGIIYTRNTKKQVGYMTQFIIFNNNTKKYFNGLTGLYDENNPGSFFSRIYASINDTLILYVHSKEDKTTYNISFIVSNETMMEVNIYTNFPSYKWENWLISLFFIVAMAAIAIVWWSKHKRKKHLREKRRKKPSLDNNGKNL